LRKAEDLANPNVVTVVLDSQDNALYFSRQAIPYVRDVKGGDGEAWLSAFPFYKHIGVYAYRMETLRAFVRLGESPLERAERLEQLRLLEAGIRIRCVEVDYESVAVDTSEDVRTVERLLDERSLLAESL
jgi:3-deoxy-manno-octulosonate cytidylyltransferase (CMP-KDO synthetase)